MAEADLVPVLARLPRYVDISCVQAFHQLSDVIELARTARAGDFASAHVLPHWVPVLKDLLAGSSTLCGAPAGFPSGGSMTSVKLAEVDGLLLAGVQELDVVVNIGRLRSGDVDYVTGELAAVVARVAGAVPLRAILEVGHLDEDEIRSGCRCAVAAGVPWVKTGTGWSGRPTTVHHVQVIADQVAGRAAIKAAGGIRDLATVAEMIRLGVTRFGMNARVASALADEAAGGDSGRREV